MKTSIRKLKQIIKEELYGMRTQKQIAVSLSMASKKLQTALKKASKMGKPFAGSKEDVIEDLRAARSRIDDAISNLRSI